MVLRVEGPDTTGRVLAAYLWYHRTILASNTMRRHDLLKMRKAKKSDDRAMRIFRELAGTRGMDDAERWQHALFFAMSAQERCHFSVKTARSALSLRRSAKKR